MQSYGLGNQRTLVEIIIQTHRPGRSRAESGRPNQPRTCKTCTRESNAMAQGRTICSLADIQGGLVRYQISHIFHSQQGSYDD
jgi:hypothetical protein